MDNIYIIKIEQPWLLPEIKLWIHDSSFYNHFKSNPM